MWSTVCSAYYLVVANQIHLETMVASVLFLMWMSCPYADIPDVCFVHLLKQLFVVDAPNYLS